MGPRSRRELRMFAVVWCAHSCPVLATAAMAQFGQNLTFTDKAQFACKPTFEAIARQFRSHLEPNLLKRVHAN